MPWFIAYYGALECRHRAVASATLEKLVQAADALEFQTRNALYALFILLHVLV
jgi:hypothetical protein